jgi:hypothetical protein
VINHPNRSKKPITEFATPTSLYQMLEAMKIEKTCEEQAGKLTFGEFWGGDGYWFGIDEPMSDQLRNFGEWLIELSGAYEPWPKKEAVE